MKHIVIIGNGISGITAARHIRKLSDHRVTVISGESDHFFSRTALMYIYMGHMEYRHTKPYEDRFWEKNRIELKKAWVKEVDTDQKSLKLDDHSQMEYDVLVLALGSKPNKFGWPGQDLEAVTGLYSLQDLETLEKYSPDTKQAVIVGGGLIGVELAEMLLTRHKKVIFLVREDRFWGNVLPKEEGELIARHMKDHHVDLRLETELKEILADEKGRARAVMTNHGEEIPCQIVGLTAGVSPNIAFIKDSKIETQRGVMVNEFLETNIPDVYAIGDCAQRHVPVPTRRPIEQVWYTGRMMGEIVAKTICGDRTEYLPGNWFNS
ncbi:MAG: FAD/NAD(P)-binding oxidoreductase, partial [Bacteroidota bacterium]